MCLNNLLNLYFLKYKMWKTDNNSELNKLYKDVKINKYI